jgi:hypothetical protein
MPTATLPASHVAESGPEARERALGILGELVARGGAASLLLPPVVPGEDAFPEPWAPTKGGVKLLLRRLAWHAGIDREIEIVIDDRRAGAPPTERKPATRVELVELRGKQARFALGFIGDDDVVGTLAHEIGTLYAVLNRPDDPEPYRSADPPMLEVDPDRDLERGAVATVYSGLGVLAANASYQQYATPGRFNGGYVPHEYDVICAGALPLSTIAYLVAVQAVVRGDSEPPAGLAVSQRHEVAGWLKTLDRAELCSRLGIALGFDPADRRTAREMPVAFTENAEVVHEPRPRKTAFRWQTNRGGIGFITGTVLGIGLAFVLSPVLVPFAAFGGATAGHLIGRRVRIPRCSACATVVRDGATSCSRCHAALRGDIANLSERLEAEERLDSDASHGS